MLALYLSMLESPQERAAFRRIYEAHYNTMAAVAKRYFPGDQKAAEDAVHESFLKIIENFPKISAVPCNKLPAYIVIIVKNTCLDMLQKQKRLVLADDLSLYDSSVQSSEQGTEDIVAIIRSMPEGYRAVLEMRFVLEMDCGEIAAALGLSEGAVRSRVSRGRKLLMEKLKEEGYTP